jgi:hypothetical protein
MEGVQKSKGMGRVVIGLISNSLVIIRLCLAFKPSTMDRSRYVHGKVEPNRLFVGGLRREAIAQELCAFFSQFTPVKDARIIIDPQGTF